MSEKLSSALLQSPNGGLFSTLSVDGSGIVIKNASDDQRSDGTFVPAGSDTLVLSAVGESSFLNASYMKVGVLDASLLRTGLLQTVASWNSKWYGSAEDSMDVQQGFSGGKFAATSVSTGANSVTLSGVESATGTNHNITSGDFVRVSGLVFDDNTYGNVGIDSPGVGVAAYAEATATTSTTITYELTGVGAGKTTLDLALPFVSKVVPIVSASRVYDDELTNDNPGELSKVTVVTASSHGLSTGNYVELAGVEDSLNGVWRVSGAPNSTTFEFWQRFVEDLDWENDDSIELPEYGTPVAIEVAKSYRVTSDGTLVAYGAAFNPAGTRRSAILLSGDGTQGDIAVPADQTLQIGYRSGTGGFGGSFTSIMTINTPASGNQGATTINGSLGVGTLTAVDATISGTLDVETKINLPTRSSPPSSPVTGTLYYNTDINDGAVGLLVYNGTEWVASGSGSGTSAESFTVGAGGLVVNGASKMEKLRITNVADASGVSTEHALTIGSDGVTGFRLVLDGNEISAKDGTADSSLFINPDGGNVTLGDVNSTVSVPGTLSAGTFSPSAITVGAGGLIVNGASKMEKLRITNVADASGVSTEHALTIGSDGVTGFRLVLDGNEISAKDGTADSSLFINPDGGGVFAGVAAAGDKFGVKFTTTATSDPDSGALNVAGGIRSLKGVYFDGDSVVDGDLAMPIPVTGSANAVLGFNLLKVGNPNAQGFIVSTSGKVFINNTEQSTSTGSGSITTLGGLGVAKNLYVGGTISAASFTPTNITTDKLFLTSTDDATGTSTTHPLTIGSSGASLQRLVLDNNEISSKSGPANAELFINPDGGNVTISAVGATVSIPGILSAGTFSPSTISTTNVTTTNLTTTSGVTLANGGGIVSIGSSTGASFSAAGKLTIANTTAATNTTTGALEVVGGVGIGGTLHAGNITTAGTFSAGIFSPSSITTTNLNSTSGSTLASGGGNLTIGGNNSTGDMLVGAATPFKVSLEDGTTYVQNADDTSGATTGALIVSGGVYVAKDLRVGDDLIVTGTLSAGTFSPSSITTTNLNSTSGSTLASGGGNLTIGGNNSTGDMLVGAATPFKVSLEDGTTYVQNADEATATAGTGALIVTGGGRFGKDVRIAGDLVVSGTITPGATGRIVRSGTVTVSVTVASVSAPIADAAANFSSASLSWTSVATLAGGAASPYLSTNPDDFVIAKVSNLTATGAIVYCSRNRVAATAVIYMFV